MYRETMNSFGAGAYSEEYADHLTVIPRPPLRTYSEVSVVFGRGFFPEAEKINADLAGKSREKRLCEAVKILRTWREKNKADIHFALSRDKQMLRVLVGESSCVVTVRGCDTHVDAYLNKFHNIFPELKLVVKEEIRKDDVIRWYYYKKTP